MNARSLRLPRMRPLPLLITLAVIAGITTAAVIVSSNFHRSNSCHATNSTQQSISVSYAISFGKPSGPITMPVGSGLQITASLLDHQTIGPPRLSNTNVCLADTTQLTSASRRVMIVAKHPGDAKVVLGSKQSGDTAGSIDIVEIHITSGA